MYFVNAGVKKNGTQNSEALQFKKSSFMSTFNKWTRPRNTHSTLIQMEHSFLQKQKTIFLHSESCQIERINIHSHKTNKKNWTVLWKRKMKKKLLSWWIIMSFSLKFYFGKINEHISLSLKKKKPNGKKKTKIIMYS